MKKFRISASIIIMIILGALLNQALEGEILFSMISGIAYVICAIDNRKN